MSTQAADRKRDSYIGNMCMPIAILAISGVLYYLSLAFPEHEDVGAAAVPHLWILFNTVFCLILLVQAVLRKGKPDPVPGRVFFVILYAVWMMLYLFAIEAAGYYISSFVFLVGSMYMMSYRRPVVAVSIAGGWLVFSYVIFAQLLYIPLPVGPLLAPILS